MALPTIFREYIGSKPSPNNFDDFPDIINPLIKEFHFIIAFASELYDERGKGTGNFYMNWHVPPINGEMIRKLKKKCDNVRVVISIGGRGPEYPFNPVEKEMWLDNAKNSLHPIINDLKAQGGNDVIIEGIDVNYDIINSSVDVYVFASYIGELITYLKYEKHLVNVVSIAPSDSVDNYYRTLYAAYEKDIDWVNYKFYTGQPNPYYPRDKLLAGFSTDPDYPGRLSREAFLKACKDLINKGELPGIFIWNANDSASNVAPFLMEWYAQNPS